ncbi:MAG: LD-carboxypeptidase [Alphaproteobacteria bacterium]|nr:LD-carboxypeptidase [Alphaproteobacteria bacterium]
MKTIGVLTSSSSVPRQNLIEGIEYWKKQGYEVKEAPHLYEKRRFIAGSDEERSEDLHAFFADDQIDLIIEAGGGNGSSRLLRRLDYDLIARHKKPLIGLSDTTALQLALLTKANLPSFTGYLMKPRFGRAIIPYTEQSLRDCLAGRDQVVSGLETEYRGKAIVGRLIGGCMTLVANLLGTPYFPDLTGSILILEDVAEEPYSVDRMLTHMENAGVFDRVAAVVFGVFRDCKAKDPADGTVDDVLNEWKKRLEVPVFLGLPYGHQAGSLVWPIGGTGVLEEDRLTVRGVDFNG